MENVKSKMTMEEILIAQGVDPDHIQRMKNLRQHDYSRLNYFFEEVGYREDVIIPVEKIHGISRGESGKTWWDHLVGRAGNIAGNRVERLLNSFLASGLNEFRRSFSDPDYAVKYADYDEERDAYYIDGDGNHRTLWARIVDAPQICCRYVSLHRRSPEKFRRYQEVKSSDEKFARLLQLCGFEVKRDGFVKYNGEYVFHHDPPRVSSYGNSNSVQERIHYMSRHCDLMKELLETHEKVKWIRSVDWRIRFLRATELFLDFRERDIRRRLRELYQLGWSPRSEELNQK